LGLRFRVMVRVSVSVRVRIGLGTGVVKFSGSARFLLIFLLIHLKPEHHHLDFLTIF